MLYRFWGKQLAGSTKRQDAEVQQISAGENVNMTDVQEGAIPLDSDDAMGSNVPEAGGVNEVIWFQFNFLLWRLMFFWK